MSELSTFAKVWIYRESHLYFRAEVLAKVIYCHREPREPVVLNAHHRWGINDVVVKRIPNLDKLPVGESIVRKLRLTTMGYDSCDRAVIGG